MQRYEELEQKFINWTGYRYASSLNSGTSALHLALLAMGVKEGDEVIVPDFTFASCGFSVLYCNAKPVFVDCDDTLNMDVDLIEDKITSKTKVIMAVHIYGRRCNIERIREIANKYSLLILEDLSEGHGIPPSGDIAIYSFQSTKIINSEEGGMLITNNEEWIKEVNLRKTLSNRGDYFHPIIGFNYRMANSLASLAIESFNDLESNLKKRREWEATMISQYGETLPPRDVVWVFDSLKPLPNSRPFFKPLSSMPMFGGISTSPKADYYSKIGNYIKI